MPKGNNSTVEDVLDGFEHMINLVGEDQVGIGTDFTQGQDTAFFHYLRSDKGLGQVPCRTADSGRTPYPVPG